MSLFDYPRINIRGTVQMNPGTANNDDYAAAATYQGEPLGLIDSINVQPRTYGMTDEEFIPWAQKAHDFPATGGGTREIIPAEWNYYGNMYWNQDAISVVGVQAGSTGIDGGAIVGAELEFTGCFTDINPEGSPPATQFFIESLTLGTGAPLITAGPTKGVGQWINFFRNVNLTADAGAGASVYHVLHGATVNIPGWDDLNADGVIFRYYLSRALLERPEGGSNAGIEAIYASDNKLNPKILEIVGTFAPYYASETIVSTATGRLLTQDTPNITTPTSNNNGGGTVALGPAVLHRTGDILTADFSGTFPDNYVDETNNPKFDFGVVNLVAIPDPHLSPPQVVGPVDYADTAQGDARGWLFDFDLSSLLDTGEQNTTYKLVSDQFGDVLTELDYYFVSNQQSIYGEENGSTTMFRNNGTLEELTIAVFHRDEELTPANSPSIVVWQYASTPLQDPGNATAIKFNFKPGEPLVVNTDQRGNFLFTFTTDPLPPTGSYSDFMNPPYVTNSPQISLRILPNENYDQYFIDPESDEPVANDDLTFDILYAEVLRTYYLLYPAMSFLPLNSEEDVQENSDKILARTNGDPANWMSIGYMPITRDLSDSRRNLLQAWCRRHPPTGAQIHGQGKYKPRTGKK